ncbi:hypothetical protein EDD21DRAFT_418591 [Dissophora ornata]|nr:hypothetical protein BGZ58_003120 [Dissophora ornata]KAI8597561.1 hypothetical protein EDD21DRAFT_418591 [Dissophora ornata]
MQAELSALERAGQARSKLQSKSATDQYMRYERYWVAFCDRLQYPNKNVSVNAATRYLVELTAEEEDPEFGIYRLQI